MHNGQKPCLRCKNLKNKDSLDENGFCLDCRLQNNNPKGFNKHKKNPEPPNISESWEHAFRGLPDMQKKDKIAEMGNEIWKLSIVLIDKKRKFTLAKKIYFGWEWE